MRRAKVFVNNTLAGHLVEEVKGESYKFIYLENYTGYPVSLTMPKEQKEFRYATFPPFFEGLLPEGIQLDGLLRIRKIDGDDYFGQLMAIGADMVGAISVEEML